MNFKSTVAIFFLFICINSFAYATIDKSNISDDKTSTLNTAAPSTYLYKDNYQEKQLYGTNLGNVTGNADGSITIIDFSDYRCIPCRKSSSVIDELIKKNKSVRVVYIDYPMLGPDSTFAAKAALAAIQQNKYIPLHNAFMRAKKPLTQSEIYLIAKAQGLDVLQLQQDIESKGNLELLLDNMMLGNAFAVVGLPTFIIGYTKSPHNTKVYAGIDPNQLSDLINQAEQQRNKDV